MKLHGIKTWICLLGLLLGLPNLQAQSPQKGPQGVDIVEHRGEKLPLDLMFVNEEGRSVRLGEYFQPRRPVILNLIYFGCPGLCSYTLNGMVDTIREIPPNVGADFDILTISFNPAETWELAAAKRKNYLEKYGRTGAGQGWHFLTGSEAAIRTLTDAVGFKFRWEPATKQYVHASAIFVCTPEGRLSRYIYGVWFDPTTLRLSLVEAGEGRIGSPLQRVMLFCSEFDPASGRYVIRARQVMKLAGVVTVLGLGTLILGLWWRERRRKPGAL